MITGNEAYKVYTVKELYDYTNIDLDKIDKDIAFKEDDDYLNRRNERNFFNTNNIDFNCGGYALNTLNWYKPYEGSFEWRVDLVHKWINEYYDINGRILEDPDYIMREVENRLLIRDTLYMLRQFKGKIRRIDTKNELKMGERLVAYRIGINYCYNEETQNYCGLDIDFHYRFYDEKNQVWLEKMGSGDKKLAEDDTLDGSDWDYVGWTYTSDIALFALKI